MWPSPTPRDSSGTQPRTRYRPDSLDGSEEVGVLDGLVHLLGEGVTQVLLLGEGDLQQLLILLWLRELLGEDRLVVVEVSQGEGWGLVLLLSISAGAGLDFLARTGLTGVLTGEMEARTSRMSCQ